MSGVNKHIFVILYFLLSCVRWLSDLYSVLTTMCKTLSGIVSVKEGDGKNTVRVTWYRYKSGHEIHIPSSQPLGFKAVKHTMNKMLTGHIRERLGIVQDIWDALMVFMPPCYHKSNTKQTCEPIYIQVRINHKADVVGLRVYFNQQLI